ncbi:tripartite tricarboxylate transporter substrate binding protein [Pigmentiphaga soli]|uniref:Tripartite tricarboxylate transporter substrate binding protein n=1 Tax=Pigmentiphaga soli TaxID=1007095 RepID=A0ABP8GM55_9BURK
MARIVAKKLNEALGQPFIVENRPGAAGMIAAQAVARAKPDGYTLLMVPATHVISPAVNKHMKYDTERDFTPINLVATGGFVLVVPTALPVNSVQELIDYSKKQPAPPSYAAMDLGSLPHLAGEMFKAESGVNFTTIPYKGGAPATVDLIAGHVSFMFNNMLSSVTNIRTGKLRPLAVTTATRLPSLPDVPTMIESGFKDYDIATWYGLLGPAGMDKQIVARLNNEINRALKSDPEFINVLSNNGLEPAGSTPEAFGQRIHDELLKWAAAVKATGLTANE